MVFPVLSNITTLAAPEDSQAPVSPVFLVVILVVLVITVGVITCVVSRRGMGGRPAVPAEPAAAPMLSSLQPSAMDRLNHELSVQRDRFVRLQSVRNDLALDLPHSIPLPDGEEIPYGSSTRLQIRDPQQESEIYQKCIRPPPNKTVFDGDSPPPYRANTGFLSSDWSRSSGSRSLASRCRSQPPKKSGDLFGRTVRCFGMRRSEEPASPPPPPPPPPCVHVPILPGNRSRQLAAFSENATVNLASVPTVSCSVPAAYMAANRPRQVIPEAYPGDKLRSHSSGVTTGVASRPPAAAASRAPAAAASRAAAAPRASAAAASRAPAPAGAFGSAPNETCDTKGPEKKSERGSV